MATIDLTTRSDVLVAFTEDLLTATTTVTFKDSSGTLELGTLRVDSVNTRALLDALQVMAESYYPNSATEPKYAKVIVSLVEKTATIGF